jgi:pre-rRNA-processing protein IPI1
VRESAIATGAQCACPGLVPLQAVLTPDGADITATWQRQAALVDAIVVRLQPFGGAGALLHALAPQLASLPLMDPASAGSSTARLQRYSLVRLATAAAEAWPGEGVSEPGGGGGAQALLPSQLLPQLPLAAALCGLELEAAAAPAAAAAAGAGSGNSSSSQGPSPQSAQSGLLASMPHLALPLLHHLHALVADAAGAGAGATGAATANGGGQPLGELRTVAAVAAALRLAQAAAKLGPCRGLLVQGQGSVVDAVRGMVRAVAALPAGCSGGGECAAEAQRLVQGVADMLGLHPNAIASLPTA